MSSIKDVRPDLIPPEADATVLNGVFRSLGRGSSSRATEEGLEGTDSDMINRWRKFEINSGGKTDISMREYYLEIKHEKDIGILKGS